MKRHFLSSLLITLFLSISSPIWSQQLIDRILAVVGNEIILQSDLNTLLLQWSVQRQENVFQNPAQLQQLSTLMLQRMIQEKLLLIKAEEDTIVADPEQVDQMVDRQVSGFVQQVGSTENLEKYYGMPLPKIKKELRSQVENQLVIEKLRAMRFSGIKVSRREVENFYQQYSDSLPTIGETVDLSHILMQVKPNEASFQEAYAKISKIRETALTGGDFLTLAKQYSEDPSAQSNSGDLGWANRSDYVQEFAEAASALEPGEISDVVQTQFGFHIIQMIEKQGDKIHVRHILIQLQPQEEDERRVVDRLSELRQQLLSGDVEFEKTALENSDDPNVSTDRGRLGEFVVGNFQVPAFETAAKALEIGEISQPFKTDFGYHIIKLHSRVDQRKLSLENDWQRIEQFAVDFKTKQKFEKWLEELKQDIPIDIKS